MGKKIFLVLVLSVLILPGFSQSQSIVRYAVLKAGTEQLINGKCEISLSKNAQVENYYVVVTPLDEYTGLYITDKKEGSFIVKSVNAANVKFDFIVVQKQPDKKLSPEFEIKNKR
jgi:hypothetical protein